MTILDNYPELQLALDQALSFLPKLIVALLVFGIGLLIAPLIRSSLRRLFRLVQLESLAEKSGVDGFLLQGGIDQTASGILTQLIYWIFIFCVLLLSLYIAGLSVAAEIFREILLYIPRILVAVAILIFGSLLARFVRAFLYSTLNHLGTREAKWMSLASYGVMMIFVVFMSLEQLQIGGEILTSAFQIVFGSICIALAISFGLGGKDKAAEWINRTFKK